MMSLVLAAIAAAGLAAVIGWSRYRAQTTSDLGTVSHQWLAEQRLNRGDSTSQR